jgi:GNAT superfamily N-acetyltransferase
MNTLEYSLENALFAIEHNYYDLYSNLGKKVTLKFDENNNLKYTMNPYSTWFSRIFLESINDEFINNNLNNLIEKIKKFELPNTWILRPKNNNKNLREKLLSRGFLKFEQIGMAVKLDSVVKSPNKIDYFKIKKIDTEELLKIWVKVSNSNFKLDEFYEVYLKFLNNKNAEIYGGFFKNDLIATSILFCSSGVAGIYSVTTKPEFRQKGIGTQMVLNVINIAQKKGFKIGILQASPEGQLVYKKLGFEDICKLYHFEYKI